MEKLKQISRREFLRQSGLAAAGAALTRFFPDHQGSQTVQAQETQETIQDLEMMTYPDLRIEGARTSMAEDGSLLTLGYSEADGGVLRLKKYHHFSGQEGSENKITVGAGWNGLLYPLSEQQLVYINNYPQPDTLTYLDSETSLKEIPIGGEARCLEGFGQKAAVLTQDDQLILIDPATEQVTNLYEETENKSLLPPFTVKTEQGELLGMVRYDFNSRLGEIKFWQAGGQLLSATIEFTGTRAVGSKDGLVAVAELDQFGEKYTAFELTNNGWQEKQEASFTFPMGGPGMNLIGVGLNENQQVEFYSLSIDASVNPDRHYGYCQLAIDPEDGQYKFSLMAPEMPLTNDNLSLYASSRSIQTYPLAGQTAVAGVMGTEECQRGLLIPEALHRTFIPLVMR